MTLQKYREQLPTEVVDLRDYILLSREKLKAYRVKLAACQSLDAAQAIWGQTLEEGQHVAEEVLYAEARLRELLSETVKPGNPQLSSRDDNCRLPEGVSLNMSSHCQKLARHPDIIERMATKAKEEDRIVTRKEVLGFV